MKNVFVVDSSSLISLSTSCLFDIMKELCKELKMRLVISKAVLDESVRNPLRIKRFELNALRINKGISDGWLEVKKLSKEKQCFAREIMETANSCFLSKHGHLKIIQLGESEILALAISINAKGIIIDERTTRMIIEEPEKLRRLLQKRHGQRIIMNKERVKFFKKNFGKLTIARSSELIALAYEKGLLQKTLGEDKEVLKAALYSLKYNGCSLSSEEIERFARNA